MTLASMGSSASTAEHRLQPVLLLRNVKEDCVKRFALEKFRLSIGRAADDDIRLPEGGGVSRNHASIFVLEGEVVIEDQGSRNGTYVNRKLIRGNRQRTLKFGDVITIGRYRLKLVDESTAQNDDATQDVNGLLRAWGAPPFRADGQPCRLCHGAQADEAHGEAETDDDQNPTEAMALQSGLHRELLDQPTIPFHGKVFGRNLPRQTKRSKQRTTVRRSLLVAGNRSSRVRGGNQRRSR